MSKNCINCVVRPRTGGDLLCDECRASQVPGSEKRKRIAPSCTNLIELGYNGDYPGYPVVRINGKWLTDEQYEFLLSLFPLQKQEGRNGLREFFDWCGAKMIPGSQEHEIFEGTMVISISQNAASEPR